MIEYTINKLARLASVSTRTLRYYDAISLLPPRRIDSSGYRIYGQHEVDLLQQILIYRELNVPLGEIKKIMSSKNYDRLGALQKHLSDLKDKRERLNLLIVNVEKTITALRGGATMNDREKFEGLKQKLLEKNEMQYGQEVREKFGNKVIDDSNAKLMGLSAAQYTEVQELSNQINTLLKAAFEQGNPSSELAQKVCTLHQKWLGYFWASYSKEAHLGLAQAYVDDPRFKRYYDNIATGCAEFLNKSLQIFCG